MYQYPASFNSSAPGAVVARTSVFPVNNAAIPFELAEYDTSGFWNIASPTRLTAPFSGVYMLYSQWQDGTNAIITGFHRLNGVTITANNLDFGSLSGDQTTQAMMVIDVVPMSAGNFIESFTDNVGTDGRIYSATDVVLPRMGIVLLAST
ncbi:MAG TPA: hypothetical protein VJ521_04260 [Acidobacteriota bacterium]|nr:hypothetical protein [Acidobacteriota bacterium]